MAKDKTQFTKEDFTEYKKLAQELQQSVNESYETFINRVKPTEAIKVLKQMRSEVKDLHSDFAGASQAFQDSVNFLKKGNQALSESVSATKKLSNLAQDLLSDKEGIYEMDKKDLEKTIAKIQKEQQRLTIASKMTGLTEQQKLENQSNLQLSNQILKGAQERLAQEQKITNQLGITGAAVKGLSTVLDKLGVGGFLEIEKINEKMREVAKDGGSKMKVLGAGMKESFKSAGLAMRDLATMTGLVFIGIKKLIDVSLKYEDKQFEVAKAMGVSVTEGREMLNNFQSMAMANGQLAMTAKQLADTYGQMNDTLGFMGPQNAEFLTTTAGIQRRLGVSAESMQLLQYSALKTGKTLTKTYSDVVGTSKAIGASLKLNMSEKQVIEAISKVSTTVLNNFKGNVKQLTAAVMTATKFGTTLDTINAQGNSLLDFESSISKEFEAQLLTGKDLNLSKARELALNHDTDGLMKELNSKMMTSAEYSKMNVLQQQSFAEAVGLSKEQMDEMYHKQEMVKLLGDDAGKSLQTQYNHLAAMGMSYDDIAAKIGDQAAQDAKRATAQEQMQATMERISDEIGKMTQGLAEMVAHVAEFFSHTENIKATLIIVGSVMAGMAAYSLMISAQKKEQLATEMGLKLAQVEQLTLNNALLASQISQNVASQTGLVTTGEAIVEEAVLTGERTAGAVAAVTAGSWFTGPGAIAIGLAAGAALIGFAMSAGGKSRSAPAASAPSSPSISPMNMAAETVKAAGPSQLDNTGKSMSRGSSPNIYITVDPMTGKKTVQTLNDTSAGTDASKIASPMPSTK